MIYSNYTTGSSFMVGTLLLNDAHVRNGYGDDRRRDNDNECFRHISEFKTEPCEKDPNNHYNMFTSLFVRVDIYL